MWFSITPTLYLARYFSPSLKPYRVHALLTVGPTLLTFLRLTAARAARRLSAITPVSHVPPTCAVNSRTSQQTRAISCARIRQRNEWAINCRSCTYCRFPVCLSRISVAGRRTPTSAPAPMAGVDFSVRYIHR